MSLENKLDQIEEELEKAAHYWKDKDPAKYKKMLSDLRSARKKPGHKERAYQEVLQAKRRERGGSGTKTGDGHAKGKMKSETSSAVKRFQGAEKKTGSKLSPDRKDNEKGYEGSNTRYVPQHLNRGRHKVDSEKLKNWKKRLKKAEITDDDLMTYMTAKALAKGDNALADMIQIMSLTNILEALGLKE